MVILFLVLVVVILVIVMAVQRIEGAEDLDLVGNWELWRRGGQTRPPPSRDDTDADVQQRGRDHARHLLKITDYTSSCKTRGASRDLLRKCVACRSHHHVRLSALPAFIVRQRWNCSRILHAAATDVHKQMAPLGL
jgi:hypothetical protein